MILNSVLFKFLNTFKYSVILTRYRHTPW